MLERFKGDLRLYSKIYEKNFLFLILSNQGLWAITQYRFSSWVTFNVHIPVIRQILIVFCAIWKKLIELTTAIEIPKEVEIGQGLYLPHAHGIVLHPNVKIGEYCMLSHDVTIGLAGRGGNQGTPKLGNRVYIAPGVKVFGKISIGNNVAIGANAVVTKDLPDNAVAVGIPAKIINYKGSDDFFQDLEK